jgi:hypothetical protein
MCPVDTDRVRRLALNEAAFRVANERMRDWPERRASPEPERFYCECGNSTCHDQLLLHLGEYERVRADPHHFVVVPGHEIPDVETVVERSDRFMVIEKDPETHSITEATDPRQTS